MLALTYIECGSTAQGYSRWRKITTMSIKSTTTFNSAILAESENFSVCKEQFLFPNDIDAQCEKNVLKREKRRTSHRPFARVYRAPNRALIKPLLSLFPSLPL